MSRFRIESALRRQLTDVAALLNEERAARLMAHIGDGSATTTTTSTTVVACFDTLCLWVASKLSNNDDDYDDDATSATNDLRAALLSMGVDQTAVYQAVNKLDWQVCRRRFSFVFGFFFCCSKTKQLTRSSLGNQSRRLHASDKRYA